MPDWESFVETDDGTGVAYRDHQPAHKEEWLLPPKRGGNYLAWGRSYVVWHRDHLELLDSPAPAPIA